MSERHFQVPFDYLVPGTCLLFSFLAGYCCDYHDFESVSTQRWCKAPPKKLYQVLHWHFVFRKSKILDVLVIYRVANLPIKKLCMIKNFYRANFSDFERIIVALKINPERLIGFKRLVNSSKINFQAQNGVLLWCGLKRAKFLIKH